MQNAEKDGKENKVVIENFANLLYNYFFTIDLINKKKIKNKRNKSIQIIDLTNTTPQINNRETTKRYKYCHCCTL